MKQSPRILINRLSHIGDCILTIPMLNAIRENHPDAFIAWAVETPAHQLLRNHPGIDEVVIIPRGWLGKVKLWPAIRHQLRAFEFDIAIDPQGLAKSAMLSVLSGAENRIGAKGEWGREGSTLMNNRLVRVRSSHIVDRSLELLTKIGIENPTARFGLPTDARSDASVQQWLDRHSISQFVVINPGGSWASKRWENDRFGSVASQLWQQHGVPTVITWAGDEELEMAREIASLSSQGSVIAEKTSLTELQSLLAKAEFFVGCDTGPMHIATSVGTPCVGLYGTTRPEDSGAYGPANIAVQKWYQSGSCRKRRAASNDAMRDILASDVIEACSKMVERLEIRMPKKLAG